MSEESVAVADESGVRRTVLSNGLTVLSEYMPRVRSVSFGAWVRSSSLHEVREKMGISHLLEHMVFKGSERRTAKEIALSLESLGGSLDAYTSREHTAYQARVLDENLPDAVDVVFDLMFRPKLDSQDLELERSVVLDEIHMVEDTPDDIVFDLHGELLWGDHPFGFPILGTQESVERLQVSDLRALHERSYVPDRVVVAVAGNVTHERLLEVLVAAGWGDLPRGEGIPFIVPEVMASTPAQHAIENASKQTHIVFGNVTVPYSDPRRHPLMLVNSLFGGGMSSRLFQRVREELALAYSIHSYQQFHADAGMQGIYVGCAPERVDEAVSAIRGELALLQLAGLTAEELAMGKRQLKGQITLSMESVSARMYRAAAVELYDEPYRPLDELLALVDAITPGGVQEVCSQFYGPELQTELYYGRR